MMAVELGITETLSRETVRRTLKKRHAAGAHSPVGDAGTTRASSSGWRMCSPGSTVRRPRRADFRCVRNRGTGIVGWTLLLRAHTRLGPAQPTSMYDRNAVAIHPTTEGSSSSRT